MRFDIRPLSNSPVSAIRAAAEHAPFLKRLAERWSVETPIGKVFEMLSMAPELGDFEAVSKALRQTKAHGQLVIAASDLSGSTDLLTIIDQITELADRSVDAALRAAAQSQGVSLAGLFVIALGKMGARELNYSSDIDIAVFFDPEKFDGGERGQAVTARRLTQQFVRLLDERTPDGYVFRTDLRLRPDPGSTPLAVSTHMAANYYESVGQNWERMVWIKARPVAGDMTAAARFLEIMKPFVWRRHLDYWAINDIHAIKRMINGTGQVSELEAVDADVKLSPGGIREIEFFAQTQQLIFGGRDRDFRRRGTLTALDTMARKGVITQSVHDVLRAAYLRLRGLEHRLQMRLDEQTHQLPVSAEKRAHVAALCGHSDLLEFDQQVQALRRDVNKIYLDLFADEDRQKNVAGNLVFTGVDDDPGTVSTLAAYGFSNPSQMIDTVRNWHRGRTAATRNKRGRELLTALLPRLLKAMSDTGNPDGAFVRFTLFFEKLRSGVQTLSMLQARPKLLEDLVATLALAPRLATSLGRRPALLESLLSQASEGAFPEGLGFEESMDEMRRLQRESVFLIGHDLLHGTITPEQAGRAYSDLADDAIREMARTAERECAQKFGPAPGTWLIAALGKLGGREMTAESDLDLLVIYDLEDPLAGPKWMTRFTQRLVTALSVETGEGGLYEVDLRLRPSGRSGPVAVSLSAFERYHLESAWTWERMALTRLRVIGGDSALQMRLSEALGRIHQAAIDTEKLSKDILDMRRRLGREKPGGGLLELKSAPGGLVDIEFVAQCGLLRLADAEAARPSTREAIGLIEERDLISSDDADVLIRAFDLFSALQQIQRIALVGDVKEDAYPDGLKPVIAKAVGLADFDTLKAQVAAEKGAVIGIRERYIGTLD